MLDRIQTHNYVNGNAFSFLEFIVLALVVAPFAIYYIVHQRILLAVIGVGIIAKCLVVTCVAGRSLLRGEKSIGIVRFYRDAGVRHVVGNEHPNMMQDTLVLTVSIRIPFALCGATLPQLLLFRGRKWT